MPFYSFHIIFTFFLSSFLCVGLSHLLQSQSRILTTSAADPDHPDASSFSIMHNGETTVVVHGGGGGLLSPLNTNEIMSPTAGTTGSDQRLHIEHNRTPSMASSSNFTPSQSPSRRNEKIEDPVDPALLSNPSKLVAMLQIGTVFTGYSLKNGRTISKPVFLWLSEMDSDGDQYLYWGDPDTGKIGDIGRGIEIHDVNGVRVGKGKGLLAHAPECVNISGTHCFSISAHEHSMSLDLVSNEASSVTIWATGLNYILKHRGPKPKSVANTPRV